MSDQERGPLMTMGYHFHEIAKSKGWWDDPVKFQFKNRLIQKLTALRVDVEARVEIIDMVDEAWPKRNFGELAMLMVTEIAEMYEEYRSGNVDRVYEGSGGKPEGGPVEAADLLIRLLENAAQRGWDLDETIERKSAYNEKRPYRHGGKLA